MSLNVVRYRKNGDIAWGVVTQQMITPLSAHYATTGELVTEVSAATQVPTCADAFPLTDVELLSPVTSNQQFVCQGVNYHQHMLESGMDPDAQNYNMIFTKASSCIAAADADIPRPPGVRLLDYEVELGLVLKTPIIRAIEVTNANLFEYVAGLVIVNDISARDIQLPQMQFYKGKSFRGFGPVGPYLCLLTEQDFPRLNNLNLSLHVNGEIRQQDNTANLIFGPAETLTELSAVQDFFPGDLIATGTPAGCALSIPPPFVQKLVALLPEALKWNLFLHAQQRSTRYLQPGDKIETRIASPDGSIDLGVQRNCVRAAA